jgi:hypothetical protein
MISALAPAFVQRPEKAPRRDAIWRGICTLSDDANGGLSPARPNLRLREIQEMGLPSNEPVAENSPATDVKYTTTTFVVAPGALTPDEVPMAGTEATHGIIEPSVGRSENEGVVWEACYSPRNFLPRAIIAALITVVWVWLAIEVWGMGRSDYRVLGNIVGIVALAFWVYLGVRLLRAVQSHGYRLTTRRLFISSGFLRRRVDQIELMRIKDLYVQQKMTDRWLDLGSVIVVSSEPSLPRAAIIGVERPQSVMDLVWQNARREQDRRATKVEQV